MILSILAGVWALVFGRITLTKSLRFKGRAARIYGACLIVAALTIGPALGFLLAALVPDDILENSFFKLMINLGAFLAIAYGTAFIASRVDLKIGSKGSPENKAA
jgi:hypothetical protein